MNELPVTVRRSIEITGLVALGVTIVYGSELIMPLLLALYLALLLLPIYRFLVKYRIPSALAIGLSLLALVITVALILWFFSFQVSKLVTDFPQIKENTMLHLQSISEWISAKTSLSTEKQLKVLQEQSNSLLTNTGAMIGGAAASLSNVFIFFGLLPIYIFLILFYRNLLVRFVFLWFQKEDYERVGESLREVENIIKNYLFGLLIQVSYMTVLLGAGLLLFGIKHALLIAFLFAILNLIPYVGALIGNLIGVLLTLSSSQELGPVLTVLIVISVVQFLDNNILMPRIVGSKVKINALATLVGVVAGGMIAGIPGMFLSLPTIAILKIVFDRTENLRQWGTLLGDSLPRRSPMYLSMIRIKDRMIRRKVPEK